MISSQRPAPLPKARSHVLSNALAPSAVYSSRSRKGLSSTSTSLSLTRAINTDVAAHSRTDPIAALNVLLKLVSSLPSRIGGCQYKLTQAEHSLSLHLLSIVEPYVYQGARALSITASSPSKSIICGLVHQPTEILDVIMSYVDSRRDLFNIGSGCKRLYDVVFPRHFEYRFIRCKVSSISVWNHLIVHRSLARNVRKLEILDERASSASGHGPASTDAGVNTSSNMVVPRGIMQRDTDLDSTDDELGMHHKQERYLSAALLRMTGLKEFKWSCNHSPISIEHVWPTLMMRCATLETVEISDNLIFSSMLSEDGSSDDSETESTGVSAQITKRVPSVLSAMKNVAFRSTHHSYGSAKHPELLRISAILNHCPNLKSLDVTYTHPRTPASQAGTTSRPRPSADEFLLYSRWANLTTLCLGNLRCASSIAPSTFLVAHPTLETLHLDMGITVTAGPLSHLPLQLPDGSLPRLRELKASRDVINTILDCPCDPPRPLETIKGFKLSGTGATSGGTTYHKITDQTFLGNLKKYSKSVRRIELSGWHDMEDVRRLMSCVPGVTYLYVGKRLGVTAQRERGSSGDKGPVTNLEEWLDVLETVPELSSLHGVKFFYEVSSLGVASSTPTTHVLGNNGASSSGGVTRDVVVAKALQSQMSLMDRSRIKKNDWTASMIAWKCPKLRRLEHWEEGSGKIVVLKRDSHADGEGAKVRWEVRRLKQ